MRQHLLLEDFFRVSFDGWMDDIRLLEWRGVHGLACVILLTYLMRLSLVAPTVVPRLPI